MDLLGVTNMIEIIFLRMVTTISCSFYYRGNFSEGTRSLHHFCGIDDEIWDVSTEETNINIILE